MTEDDIRYLFDSNDKYPVSNEFIANYITAPKKISIKKMIEQNNLTAVKDYYVTMNDEYSFTINAFKHCIINYKCKFVKLFIDTEESIFNERIESLKNTINTLENKCNFLNVEKKDIEDSVDINEAVKNDNIVPEDIYLKVNNITSILNDITLKLQLLPEIKEQVTNLSNISEKLDKVINMDVHKQLENCSKKINSINIM